MIKLQCENCGAALVPRRDKTAECPGCGVLYTDSISAISIFEPAPKRRKVLPPRYDLIKEEDRPYLYVESTPPFDVYVCLGPNRIAMERHIVVAMRDPTRCAVTEAHSVVLSAFRRRVGIEISRCLIELCGSKERARELLEFLVDDPYMPELLRCH